MSLNRFRIKTLKDYGLLPGWVTVLVDKAYSAGAKEGKAQERRRNEAYTIDAIPNHGLCEVLST